MLDMCKKAQGKCWRSVLTCDIFSLLHCILFLRYLSYSFNLFVEWVFPEKIKVEMSFFKERITRTFSCESRKHRRLPFWLYFKILILFVYYIVGNHIHNKILRELHSIQTGNSEQGWYCGEELFSSQNTQDNPEAFWRKERWTLEDSWLMDHESLKGWRNLVSLFYHVKD